MLEKKIIEKDRVFGAKMLNQLRHWANWPGYRSTDYLCTIEECKKHSLFSSSLSFSVEGFVFSVEVWLRVTVTCPTLNAPTTSESVNPQLDLSRLLFDFLAHEVRSLQIESSTSFMSKRKPAFICVPTCFYLKSSHSFLGALNLHLHVL